MFNRILLRLFGVKQPSSKNDLKPDQTYYKTSMPIEGVTFDQWMKGEWIKTVGFKQKQY